MSETFSLIRFQSSWQGRNGFDLYTLEGATGRILPSGSVKTRKMLKKGKGGVDGIILQPAWPTTRRLCVRLSGETLHLSEVVGNRIDYTVDPIDIGDSSFRTKISERGLYRTFTFANDAQKIVFSDMEGRLLGPERTAFDIFPATDFSPFARLIRMIDDPLAQRKLIEDLKRHRFEYPDWIEAGRNGPYGSAQPVSN